MDTKFPTSHIHVCPKIARKHSNVSISTRIYRVPYLPQVIQNFNLLWHNSPSMENILAFHDTHPPPATPYTPLMSHIRLLLQIFVSYSRHRLWWPPSRHISASHSTNLLFSRQTSTSYCIIPAYVATPLAFHRTHLPPMASYLPLWQTHSPSATHILLLWHIFASYSTFIFYDTHRLSRHLSALYGTYPPSQRHIHLYSKYTAFHIHIRLLWHIFVSYVIYLPLTAHIRLYGTPRFHGQNSPLTGHIRFLWHHIRLYGTHTRLSQHILAFFGTYSHSITSLFTAYTRLLWHVGLSWHLFAFK